MTAIYFNQALKVNVSTPSMMFFEDLQTTSKDAAAGKGFTRGTDAGMETKDILMIGHAVS